MENHIKNNKAPRNKPNQGSLKLTHWVLKEIEDDSKKWKDSIMLLEELALLKWPYYPKQSTD